MISTVGVWVSSVHTNFTGKNWLLLLRMVEMITILVQCSLCLRILPCKLSLSSYILSPTPQLSLWPSYRKPLLFPNLRIFRTKASLYRCHVSWQWVGGYHWHSSTSLQSSLANSFSVCSLLSRTTSSLDQLRICMGLKEEYTRSLHGDSRPISDYRWPIYST